MKRIILALAAVICVNVVFTQERFTVRGLTYRVIRTKEVVVDECNKSASKIKIPSTVWQNFRKYNVTEIGFGAFDSIINVTTVVIPQSIITIEAFAFYNCTKLSDFNIPTTVEYIGKEAFHNTAFYNNKYN